MAEYERTADGLDGQTYDEEGTSSLRNIGDKLRNVIQHMETKVIIWLR